MAVPLRLQAVPRPTEDDALVAELQRGDTAAIERTLLMLVPRVRRWLFRLLGPRAELDDATQDALIEIARSLPKYDGRGSVGGMAHTISVRVAYRYFGRRTEVALDTVEPIDVGSPGTELEFAL